LQAAATLQYVTSAAVTLVAFFTSVILIAWADYCADPVASTLQVFGQVNVTATPLYPYAAYYTTCGAPGAAPQQALTPTHVALAQVVTAGLGVAQSLATLASPGGPCPGDPNLVKTYGQLLTVFPGNISAAALGINCTQPTGTRMNDAVFNQICGGMFNGFAAFVACFLAVSCGMFLMLVTSVVVYNHYEEVYWSQPCFAAAEEEEEEEGTYDGKKKDAPYTRELPPTVQPPARNLMTGRPLLWGSVQASTAHESRWHDDALMELYGRSAFYGAPASPASRRPADPALDPAGGIGRADPVKDMPKYTGSFQPKQGNFDAYTSLLYAPTVTEPQAKMNLRYRERQRRPPKEGGDGDAFAAPAFGDGEGDGDGEEKAADEGEGKEGEEKKDDGKKSWFSRFRKKPEPMEEDKKPPKEEGKEADDKGPLLEEGKADEKPNAGDEAKKGKEDDGNDDDEKKKKPPRDQQTRVY